MMFGQMNPGLSAAPPWYNPAFTHDLGMNPPRVDVYQAEGSYRLVVDLPGVGDDDVAIYIEQGSVTLEGRYPDTRELGQPVNQERPTGSFSRRLPIPSGVDVDRASAQFDRGLLMLELPVGETQMGKRVKIDRRRAAKPKE